MVQSLLVTRRLLLAGGAMALLSACNPTGPVEATVRLNPSEAASVRFRAIRVDTSRIAERGLPDYAERLKPMVQQSALAAFGPRLAPQDKQAPTLVIRVDSIQLASYAGGGHSITFSDHSGGGGELDWIDGAGLIVAANGKVLADEPLFASQDPGSGGAWFLPDNEDRRTASLCDIFVQWIKRQMQL
ncbi:hypothetical protein [Methylovirgula sp. 4M-Z18]|uniref:hypothetical protein n=1 Tax=Methylovirgula sp. 4M-Z18 TaxID=2293567 RepID=UPI000E2EF2C6|nr:hypothetical protein [Methylovirgula sp. 4M-Z18]RFB81393.1 hypothetical protein DYH55_08190 [Methylovirgula sp. 4M-Z18]